jgi:serine/threonine protein phosphatase PrpC
MLCVSKYVRKIRAMANYDVVQKTETGPQLRDRRFYSGVVPKEGRPQDELPGDAVRNFRGGGVVCDGAGGEGDDWKVAMIGADTIADFFNGKAFNLVNYQGDPRALEKAVADAMTAAANKQLLEARAGKLEPTASTTANICLEYRSNGKRFAVVGNIGDGKTIIRDKKSGALREVSRDHSIVRQLRDAGQLTADEAFNHPKRNFVYKFLDAASNMRPDEIIAMAGIITIELSADEDVIMYSDGIGDNVHPEHLESLSKRFANKGETSKNFATTLFEVAQSIARKGIADHAKSDDFSFWLSASEKDEEHTDIRLDAQFQTAVDAVVTSSDALPKSPALLKARVPIFDSSTRRRLNAAEQVEIMRNRGFSIPNYDRFTGQQLTPDKQIATFDEGRFSIPVFDSVTGIRLTTDGILAALAEKGIKIPIFDIQSDNLLTSEEKLEKVKAYFK